MLQNHTPTPWEIEKSDKFYSVRIPTGKIGLPNETGYCVFQPTPYYNIPEQRTNAEFIVRACNAHDDFVAACELTLENLKPIYTSDHLVIKMLNDALAKGKGNT